GALPQAITVDPAGRFVYVTHDDEGAPDAVSGFTIDATTGALSPISGSPFPTGSGSIAAIVDPFGQFVYVANSNSGDISCVTIDAITGALTRIPGSPFPAAGAPQALTVDPSGRFVYVTNTNFGSVPDNIARYTIDGSTGALTEVLPRVTVGSSTPVS